MKKIKRFKSGFSLIEMMLVTVIVAIFMTMKMNEIQQEQMSNEARFVSQKIENIANATNAYINLNYDKLIVLENNDIQKCNADTNSCIITFDSLKKTYLLPESFVNKDKYIEDYEIILKRSGVTPNYMINGIIISKNPVKTLSKNVDPVFLGNLIKKTGFDAGYVDKNGVLNGSHGAWSMTSSDYSEIKEFGQFAVRVGYDSNMFSIYLRRDGTLPMTGNLNLDKHDINNIKNFDASGDGVLKGKLTAEGNIESKSELIAGSWIRAKNGYGDLMSIGGDASSNDYEIRLDKNKPLSLYSVNFDPNLVKLKVDGGVEIRGNIKTDLQVIATGNITSEDVVKGKYLTTSSTSIPGGTCSPNGIISKDNAGAILSCINGIWSTVDSTPVGSIVVWGNAAIPSGWLELNGQRFDAASNLQLAKLYPSGVLPDFRGYTLRAWDRGRGVDSEPNRGLLSIQRDAIIDHTHIAGTETAYHDKVPTTRTRNTPGGENLKLYQDRTGGVNTEWGDVRMAKENRVKNIAVIYIIKAR